MKLVFKSGKVEIWEAEEDYGLDYYVYGVTASGDPRVCPSLGMAHEVAGGAL